MNMFVKKKMSIVIFHQIWHRENVSVLALRECYSFGTQRMFVSPDLGFWLIFGTCIISAVKCLP